MFMLVNSISIINFPKNAKAVESRQELQDYKKDW